MSYSPEEIEDFIRASQGISSSTTPTPNRRVFPINIDPNQTTMSKGQYMARAIRVVHQFNPNVQEDESAHYYKQYERAYGEYLLTTPRTPPPPPPNVEFLPPLPPTISTPTPINVIVQRSTYTEKEREVGTLRVEATVNEFLMWQKGAREKLSLIEHFKEDLLTMDRGAIIFDPSIPQDQTDQLYMTTWTKIQMAIRKLAAVNSGIANIEATKVHDLWERLQETYLPTTELERFKMENEFNSLKQGNLSCRELRQIALPIAKAKIVCMLLLTLTNESLRTHIYNLSLISSLPVDDFLRSILTYEKTMERELPAIKVEAKPSLPTQPVALVVEQSKSPTTRAFTGKCYQCNKIGHKGSDCPLRKYTRTDEGSNNNSYNKYKKNDNNNRNHYDNNNRDTYDNNNRNNYDNNNRDTYDNINRNQYEISNRNSYDNNNRGNEDNNRGRLPIETMTTHTHIMIEVEGGIETTITLHAMEHIRLCRVFHTLHYATKYGHI